MNTRRITVGLLASAALATAIGLAPSATAATPQADSCTQNWSISSAQGYASGQWCNNNTKVIGTVHDNKSDGKCPYVRGYESNGSYADSHWATGNGTSASVTLYAASGAHFTSVAMEYITC